MARGIPGFLGYRVVNRFDSGNNEVIADLPHLHQSTWKVVGFEPGMPSSSLVGGFRIPLPPPGSPVFKKYWAAYYSKLARYQRIEGYLGYNAKTIGRGKMAFAGIITGIARSSIPPTRYELIGETDLGLANRARPFPGELLANDVTSAILKSYLGVNELGWADTFTPFTSGNYTSVILPGGTLGAWSATTDDGLNVVTCSTGIATALIAKTGAAANDRWHTQYVEAQGRLVPSSDAANAGQLGIGFSQSNANGNNAILGFVTAQKSITGRYQLQCGIQSYSGGVVLKQGVGQSLLFDVDDPNGKIPFTVGLLITIGGNSNGTATASLVVNGRVVMGNFQTGYDPGNLTFYPFVEFEAPTTGSATVYYTNLAQFTRFSTDGPSTAATFGNGSISTSTNSVGYGVDPGPSFLDVWTRLATRDGNLLRYTSQPYVVGTRTLGVVDYATDPGNDLTAKVIARRRDGTLIGIALDDNSDSYSGGTEMVGLASVDGGGVGYWRDIATLQAIGVIEDQALALTYNDANTLRAAARSAMATKVAVDAAGNKQAVILRDPRWADTYVPLDRITVDDPEMGINMLAARIVAREFTEGALTESLTLDHFSWHGNELGF